jgi:hypothetical protein
LCYNLPDLASLKDATHTTLVPLLTGSPTAKQSRRIDLGICIALFLCVSSVYFATATGITCSNDGSHYALARALVEKKSFEISGFSRYAEGNDIARRGNQTFSDRPPGTALVTSLLYAAGRFLPPPLTAVESRHDADNPQVLYAMLTSVWAGAGTVVLLYLLLREIELPTPAALTASLMFSVGTTHWKYSSVLFSHALSSFTILLSVYLTVRTTRRSRPHWTLPLAIGFALGYSVLVEYSNGIVVVVVALYLLLTHRSLDLERPYRYAILFLVGGLVPASFLAYYNTVNFGNPFALSYTYAVKYRWAGEFTTTFDFPLGQGLRAMLLWGEGGGWCEPICYNQGLFLLSPFLLLSLPGLVPFYRTSRREFVLTIGLFLIALGLFSKHKTFHGFTGDGRYLVPFIGLWCIPLGFTFDRLHRSTRRPTWQAVAYLIFYGLFSLSLCNVFLHIGHSYNYHLDLGQLNPLIASPANWRYLSGQIFRNAGNLPILWLLEASALLVFLLTAILAPRCKGQTP